KRSMDLEDILVATVVKSDGGEPKAKKARTEASSAFTSPTGLTAPFISGGIPHQPISVQMARMAPVNVIFPPSSSPTQYFTLPAPIPVLPAWRPSDNLSYSLNSPFSLLPVPQYVPQLMPTFSPVVIPAPIPVSSTRTTTTVSTVSSTTITTTSI